MSEQRKVAEALQPFMVPGRRYRINELIELLPRTDYVFSDLSRTPNNAEPNRPRWNRWVRNAVRNSPDRTDHGTNWWDDLRAEWVGPKKPDWDYWIEIDAGIVTSDEEIPLEVHSDDASLYEETATETVVTTYDSLQRAVRLRGLGALLESGMELCYGHWWYPNGYGSELHSEDTDYCVVLKKTSDSKTLTVLFADGGIQEVPEAWVWEYPIDDVEELASEWYRDEQDRTLLERIARFSGRATLNEMVRDRPLYNDGWKAEERVRELLSERGWNCYDVSKEGLGFDILAKRANDESRRMYVEVKSSVSKLMGIDLTANEWRAANLMTDSYFIAYFDDFDSNAEQEPSWIRDPSKIEPTERQVTSYFLPRSKWH